MFLLLADFPLPNTLRVPVGNDPRSPYRFVVTNNSWAEWKDGVIVGAFAGKTLLARIVWKRPGFPNVYRALARRQKPSGDILIAATCDGNLTQYTGVWLFCAKTKRFGLLNQAISNADDSRLAYGIVREQGVDRWTFYPPRNDSLDGWYHRTWTYSRKAQRLIPGSWKRGMLRR